MKNHSTFFGFGAVLVMFSSIFVAGSPAQASIGDGCYIAHGGVRWANVGMDWSPKNGEGETYKTSGPNAGVDGCRSASSRTAIRQDVFSDPDTTVTLITGLYVLDAVDNNVCSAYLSDSSDQVLANFTMTTWASSIFGELEVSGSLRQTLQRDAKSLSIHLTCTYKTPAVTTSWTFPVPIDVAPAPAGLFPGVSIDDGALATNTEDVSLNLSWDGIADKVAISNDGGFAQSRTVIREITTNMTKWKLSAAAGERLPKIVYVRYHYASGWSGSYTDDIILDTVPPTISSASVDGTRVKKATLRISAKDNRTSVARVMVASAKSGGKRATAKYSSKVIIKFSASDAKFVRVQDGAGNWSKWKALTTKSR